jgi:uncharacterized protein YdhG (YjbR/CyaY superfamily)
MKANAPEPATIDAYIATFPTDVQTRLTAVRQAIHKAAPDAVEAIKYRMPTFVLNGRNLVHFAGYAHHIGFYPTPSGIEAFKKELARYPSAKGSVQFPLDRPIPYPLIGRITRFRVKESLNSTAPRRRG